ncbi:MAG: hypothetical protein OXC62_00065 [Aestuariivita sp.]|nr:hypothetical protein [Aestuariivita sp.]
MVRENCLAERPYLSPLRLRRHENGQSDLTASVLLSRLPTFAAAALVAMVVAAPVAAQNCMTFFAGGDYDCYQSFVWHNQGKGTWCARDWYRSCMHSGLNSRKLLDGMDDHRLVMDPNQPASGNNLGSEQNGWVTGYTFKDKSKAAPQRFYASGGQIIVHPYVCRGSLKKSPGDPGQRIQSNDSRAEMFFPAPTLAEIRRYIKTGSCGGYAAGGNQDGTGC